MHVMKLGKSVRQMILLQYLLKRNIIKAKQGTVSQLCSLLEIQYTLYLNKVIHYKTYDTLK